MNVTLAEALILRIGIPIVIRHRFALDTGTVLRLENYAMINIFDDGRYYIQGDNTEEVAAIFSSIEAPWDPATWSGEVPKQIPAGQSVPIPPTAPNSSERLDF